MLATSKRARNVGVTQPQANEFRSSMTGMEFPVGPWVYKVIITAGKLRADDGEEVAGLHVWTENAVYISGIIPIARRIDVLFHELRHAWRNHFGRTILGDEDDANNAASFAAMCYRELTRQGGEQALMELRPTAKSNGKRR